MPVKEPCLHVRVDPASCPRCGHPELQGTAEPWGADHLWFAYCPSCRQVQEHASIPGWFGMDLSPPAPHLH